MLAAVLAYMHLIVEQNVLKKLSLSKIDRKTLHFYVFWPNLYISEIKQV